MKHLGRYLGRTALSSTAAALAVVAGIALLSEFFQQSERVGGAYTVAEILRYLLFNVPGLLREYIPYAALLGCLVGLGTLARNSELTAMQAGGQSPFHLAWQVLKPVLVLSFAVMLLAQWPAPQAQRLADSRRSTLLEGAKHASSLWYREGSDYLHFSVPSVQGGAGLEDFRSYRVEGGRIVRVRSAERVRYRDGQWQLQEVADTFLQETDIRRLRYPSQPWDTALVPEELRLLLVPPAHQPLTDMLRHIWHLERRGLDSAPYRLALWRIILQPLTVAGLVLLGFAFLVGPMRQASFSFRIAAGIAAGLLFSFLQGIAGSAALVFHFAPLWAALALPLLCIFIGLALLHREN